MGKDRGRAFSNLSAALSLALAVVVAGLWARNAFASDAFTLWWFDAEERGNVVHWSEERRITASGWYGGRYYGSVRIYSELSVRTVRGALVLRFFRREGDVAFYRAVHARAAQGLRPASGSLWVSRDPALLARGRGVFGDPPGGANRWINDPPSPWALTGWQVGAPLWLLLLALLVPPSLAARGRACRRRAARTGACPACGYDLRATPDRCPECGAIPRPPPAAAAWPADAVDHAGG